MPKSLIRKSKNNIFGLCQQLQKMSGDIKELPEFISGAGEVKDFDFIQLLKTDKGFIYEVRLKGCDEANHFEVFSRKVSEGYIPNVGPTGEFAVRYPKSNEFGKSAYTVYTIDRAKEILETFK